MTDSLLWIALGALNGVLSVVFGAFGAHLFYDRMDERMRAVYHTASSYQMYHALALLALGLWAAQDPTRSTTLTGWAFFIGTFIFSGSLYALSLSGVRILGAITPIGGLILIGGWAHLLFLAVRSQLNR